MAGSPSATPRSTSSPLRRLLLGTGVIALLLLFGGAWTWLATLESLALDQRFLLRHRLLPSPPSDSVVIGIADSSFTLAERAPDLVATSPELAALDAHWPWDRRVFARTVRRLRAAGARLIVFDIVFASANAGDPEFAAALAEPGAPVVLASLWQVDHSLAGEATAVLLEPQTALLTAAGTSAGFANVWPDADGVLRQAQAQLDAATLLGLPSTGRNATSSLAFAAARALDPTLSTGGPALIDYHTRAQELPIIPIEDLFLTDRWDGPWLQSGAALRDRIVWVGPLSEVRFKDVHQTPLGRMPGVLAQAQAFETFRAGSPLHRLAPAWTHAFNLLLVLGALALTLRPRRATWQVAWALSGLATWLLLAFAAFVALDLIIPLVAPAACWLGGSALGIGAQLVTEQRERRRLRAMLGRYVSEEVATLIADQPDAFTASLRGQRRDVTVLFADLRGFTAWVEDAQPEAFVEQLNEYFAAVVDCVLAHGGTLQKYIGDAVLAVWGDTRSLGPAADSARAVSAALAMQSALTRLNARWQSVPGRAPLRLAIGVHHGSVMLGNVGHPRRMEFTVMGDAVNTASRLETANRPLDTDILVSGATADLLAEHFHFLPAGPAHLKGKREALPLALPVAAADQPTPPWWDDALAAQTAWEHGETATAHAHWQQAAAAGGPFTPYFQRRLALAATATETGPLDLTAK